MSEKETKVSFDKPQSHVGKKFIVLDFTVPGGGAGAEGRAKTGPFAIRVPHGEVNKETGKHGWLEVKVERFLLGEPVDFDALTQKQFDIFKNHLANATYKKVVKGKGRGATSTLVTSKRFSLTEAAE